MCRRNNKRVLPNILSGLHSKQLNLSELKGYFSINENDNGQESKYVVSLTRQIEDGTIPDTILFRFLSDIDIRGH